MLPFQYAIRNLLRDPVRLFQKIMGSALVVFLIFTAGSFNHGMDRLLRSSGSDQNVIFLGAGSEESVERSEVAMQAEDFILAGVRNLSSRMDQPAVSGEVHYMGMIELSNGQSAQGLLRGVTMRALEVHQKLRLIDGHFPAANEVMVGKLAYRALGMDASDLQPGAMIEFEGQTLTVSGVFNAPGTVLESEIWFKRSDLMALTQRDSLSCVIVRMDTAEAFKYADLFAKQRLDLELVPIKESTYYAQLSSFYAPIRWMTWLTTWLVAAGAVFGGLNMIYAAFSSRIRELAALQTIGFSRVSIFLSLVQESVLTTMIGTLVGSIFAIFLLEGTSVYFSIGTFSLVMSPILLLTGLFVGVALGIIGTIPPALRCLTTELPKALRA